MKEKTVKSKWEQLRSGEKLICDKCGRGFFIPFNTAADKAHTFDCSNPECDNYIHCDPQIDIE